MVELLKCAPGTGNVYTLSNDHNKIIHEIQSQHLTVKIQMTKIALVAVKLNCMCVIFFKTVTDKFLLSER